MVEKEEIGSEKASKPTAFKVGAGLVMPKKGIVAVNSLFIRKDHDAKSESVGGLVKGNEVTVLETWSDGKNMWGKLGPDQWAALVYDGETYIKFA